jgi:hypothetical protein
MIPVRSIGKQINTHQIKDGRQDSHYRSFICTKPVMRDISDLVLLMIPPDDILIIRFLDMLKWL